MQFNTYTKEWRLVHAWATARIREILGDATEAGLLERTRGNPEKYQFLCGELKALRATLALPTQGENDEQGSSGTEPTGSGF